MISNCYVGLLERDVVHRSNDFFFFLDEVPQVIFTTDPKSRGGIVVEGSHRKYKATDLCHLNGIFVNPGFIHDVLLTGLQPSTTYYYSCGVEGVSCSGGLVKFAVP